MELGKCPAFGKLMMFSLEMGRGLNTLGIFVDLAFK